MMPALLLAAVSENAALGAVAASALGSAAVMWWRLQKSIRLIREQAAARQSEMESTHLAREQHLIQLIEEAETRHAALAATQEEARRQAADAATRARKELAKVQADLETERAISARVPVLEARIAALQAAAESQHGALTSEQGRAAALEQALGQATRRADSLEARLGEEEAARAEIEAGLTRHLQAAAEERSRLGTAEQDLAALRARHDDYRQQAETRIANLQRQLTAAEARAALVQKEFMSAVGVTSAPSAVTSASAPENRRAQELEQKVAQIEAESRKRAREDSYKIAELEFRLAEAREEAARLQPPAVAESENPGTDAGQEPGAS